MRLPTITLAIFGLIVVLVTGFWPVVVSHTFNEQTWGLYSREFFENVLVEAHGALIDLFVIGVVLFWFERRRDAANTIKSHMHTLADLRFYRGPDASYRILGQLKRLVELGVQSFQLPEAILNEVEISDVSLKDSNLRAVNFANTTLLRVTLENCQCEAAIFAGARFRHVVLSNVNLRRAKFQGAQLNGCNFSGCELQMADFTNADLRSAIFRDVDCRGVKFKNADLRSANFIGAKNLDPEALKEAKNFKYVKDKHHHAIWK
ncbi:pentapeptide repeat-containing protein [Variovorax sp. J22P168]|uniref:pentapeptide repeat-containing protein n=1 Tax=Variovorax jilinensis TaxID=3053513 RepID=UPI002576C608|nr:pentapeptide repeat-containing protein [Variovorax sp. J22P168]MDM0012002.1 pentapeptide repeat-containing protein [Variovorax sp. J22P168]